MNSFADSEAFQRSLKLNDALVKNWEIKLHIILLIHYEISLVKKKIRSTFSDLLEYGANFGHK